MKPGHIEIITPEGVILEYETAGIGSRAAALFVDTLLLALVSVLLVVPALIREWDTFLLVIVVVFAAFSSMGYFMLFELLLKGQTPGKRLAKIRVVKTNGSPATAGAIVMRNLLRIIDQLPMFYLIGIISAFVNTHERRIGDLIAGTMVVKELSRKPFVMPTRPTGMQTVDVVLSPHEILILQSYFQREKELAKVRREQLQREYIEYFKTKYDIYPTENEKASDFLRALASKQ